MASKVKLTKDDALNQIDSVIIGAAEKFGEGIEYNEGGVYRASEKDIESLLEEGESIKDIKQSVKTIQRLNATFAAANGTSGIVKLKETPELDKVSTVVNVGGLTFNNVVHREGQLRNVQTGEVSNVKGHNTSSISMKGVAGRSIHAPVKAYILAMADEEL